MATSVAEAEEIQEVWNKYKPDCTDKDLRNRLISVRDFRQQLESVISDEAAREELLAELEKVVPSVRDDAGEAGD